MSDQRYRVDRRRFLRDSALVSLGIVAAACAPGTTTTGGTAKKGGEFHAACIRPSSRSVTCRS